jgi:hypothetical protein
MSLFDRGEAWDITEDFEICAGCKSFTAIVEHLNDESPYCAQCVNRITQSMEDEHANQRID